MKEKTQVSTSINYRKIFYNVFSNSTKYLGQNEFDFEVNLNAKCKFNNTSINQMLWLQGKIK